MEQIKVSDITIDVVRKDIKNIHLAVYPPTGRVRIAAPLKTNDDSIRLFAISKIGWIKRNQRKFKGQERISPREYKQREAHYFQGKRFLLNIIETDTKPKVELKGKKRIDLYVRPNSSIEKKHEILTEWYRSQLKNQIPSIIEKWEKRLDLKVNEWQIKLMKTKWGSCNIEKKKILINLELAKKPERCLEYIIVHEMIHFKERLHNERFLYYMDTYFPNWKQLKKELNNLPVSHADWSY
ncbi:SprT family zinc-dependent metalloprotease [Marinifilum fragile]|uniref:M48 family metallopeptidase n=1 Tax=Marinifilum fragile TaxID=570161 RepID=UPI002AA92FC3|nr:SprT family zinc-dependent metalloprotease [Marinifilum fragile]